MRRLSSFLRCSMSRRLSLLNWKETNSPLRWCQSNLNTFFSKTTYVDESYIQYNSLSRSFQCNKILSCNRHYARFFNFSTRKETENPNLAEFEIISKEFIKPTTPTPQHSRTYEVSLFDQIMPNVYMSFVYFYPKNHQNDDGLISKRRRVLKQSLSQTLTKFYPFAGRIKDIRHIDCNDDGVYYVEAKINDHLSDFLKHPADNKSIHRLLPLDPNSEELISKKDLVMVQVTVFGCGGISVGLYTAHKIIDGYSLATFVKSWSTTARLCSEQSINPTFISSSVFPSNPALPHDASCVFFPLYSKNKNATRRFLFRASSLATLTQKAESSRVLAVTGLIWKCAIAASRANISSSTPESSSSTLTLAVNLRDRTSPPTPPHSIGNFFTITTPIECSENDDFGLDFIVRRLMTATSLFSSEFIEEIIGYWRFNAEAVMNQLKTSYSNKNAKHMVVTSTCRTGTYEADFGWGKPIWVCVGNGDSKSQFTENFVVLMDTKCGNGIEAWVTLNEEDMVVFERDPEILAFASLNANPLE